VSNRWRYRAVGSRHLIPVQHRRIITTPDHQATRTKPKGERRSEILGAALAMFDENGYENTTVQQIAVRAGVAAGTVYLYFGSKREVLLGIHQDFHEGMQDRFLEIAAEFVSLDEDRVNYRVVIDEALDAMVDYSLEKKIACKVIARNLSVAGLSEEAMEAERRFADFLARAFETGIHKGLIAISDPEMAALMLSAAVSVTLARAVAYEDIELDRLVAQAKELYHKALAPPPS
jgi:AcrR family transcriptional regulator